MIPAGLHEFLVAAVGASASFIGLLFVALTVVFARNDGRAQFTANDRLQAQSAYAALVNIFFVTMIGLVPDANIGPAALVLAALGLISCWRLRAHSARVPLALSIIVYAGEAVFAAYTFAHYGQPVNTSDLQTIVLVLFGLGLYRAWELTGIRRK